MRIFLQELLRMSLLGTGLGLALLLAQPVLRKLVSHRVRYYLWLAVLLRLCLPFGVSLPIPSPAPEAAAPSIEIQNEIKPSNSTDHNPTQGMNQTIAPAAPNPAPAAPELPSAKPRLQWTRTATLFSIWCIGAVFFLGDYTISYRRLARALRRNALPVGYQRGVEVISSQVSTPMLIGVFHPTIVLPQGVEGGQMEDILAHELTHARRHDLLYKWFAAFVTSLHWFNPFMILLRREINRACELSCDEAVTRNMLPEERRRYGETLLALAAGPGPRFGAVALCEEKEQLKERLVFLVKGTKKGPLAAVLAAVLTVTVCGCAAVNGTHSVPTPAPGPAGSQPAADVSSGTPNEALLEDPLLYERDGYTVALPREWEGKVLIDVERNPEGSIITVHEKASYEQSREDWGEGSEAGFLFSLFRFDQIQFEDYLSADSSGVSVFARDENYYYAEGFPTDVQYYRSGGEPVYEGEDWSTWSTMVEQVEDVKRDFIARNNLQTYDSSEFYDRDFTYDGEHRYVVFYPYYDYQDLTGVDWRDAPLVTVLSQPAKQGEGGIWCVERYFDVLYPNWYIEMPTYSGMAAADFYNMLQSQADETGESEYLTLEGAVRAWVRDSFQDGRTVSPESIVLLEDVPAAQPYKYAQRLLTEPGRFGWMSNNELVHAGDCPDGVSDSLYWILAQTPWAELEGVSADDENLVFYETEGGDRVEIYDSGIVMIYREGGRKIYRPLWNNENGEVYDAAVSWVTSLQSHTQEDVWAAEALVRAEFQQNYRTCTLEKVYYDARGSQSEAERQAEYRGAEEQNVILICADFRTPKELGQLAAFNPDFEYIGYKFILMRETPEAPWEIVDAGY